MTPGVIVSKDTGFPPSNDLFRQGSGANTGKPGLLDELDDIRSLLGDALDGPASGLHDDLDIPLLEPETPQPTPTHPRAAAAEQAVKASPVPTSNRPGSASLASASLASTSLTSAPLEDLLSVRENPFLPRHTMERLAQHRAHTPEGLRPAAPASATTSAPLNRSTATPARPSDASIRAAVDEILAVWMPRIERELRDRLTQQLRDGDDA